MLLVTEHAKSLTTGFSAFGLFTVKPEGKNFFCQTSASKPAISTGWTAQTSRLAACTCRPRR